MTNEVMIGGLIPSYFLTEKAKKDISYLISNEIDNNFNVSIYFIDEKDMKNINKKYRGKDYATNVLSFAYQETEETSTEIMNLGEVLICQEEVEKDAKEKKISNNKELYFVLIHGLLHLLGYDHNDDDEEREMQKKEQFYLNKFLL